MDWKLHIFTWATTLNRRRALKICLLAIFSVFCLQLTLFETIRYPMMAIDSKKYTALDNTRNGFKQHVTQLTTQAKVGSTPRFGVLINKTAFDKMRVVQTAHKDYNLTTHQKIVNNSNQDQYVSVLNKFANTNHNMKDNEHISAGNGSNLMLFATSKNQFRTSDKTGSALNVTDKALQHTPNILVQRFVTSNHSAIVPDKFRPISNHSNIVADQYNNVLAQLRNGLVQSIMALYGNASKHANGKRRTNIANNTSKNGHKYSQKQKIPYRKNYKNTNQIKTRFPFQNLKGKKKGRETPYCNGTRHPNLYYRQQWTMVNKYETRLILNAPDVCKNNPFLVIIVHSLHSNEEKRDAIRKTWGSVAKGYQWPVESVVLPNIALVFLFGVHEYRDFNEIIRDEGVVHNDVIQGDFVEAYQNITKKNIMGLKWVHDYCSKANFVLKMDDDVFVNIPRLIKLLYAKRAKGMKRSIMGPKNVVSLVMRNPASKWSLTCQEFPFEKFPVYMSGSAYILTSDVVYDLFTTSQYVYPIFIDDVFVTGILARILNVPLIYIQGFVYHQDTKHKGKELLLKNKRPIYTFTVLKPEDALKVWRELYSLGLPRSVPIVEQILNRLR